MNTIVIELADVQDVNAPSHLQHFVGINCNATEEMPVDPLQRTPAEKIACAVMALLTNAEWLAAATGASLDNVIQTKEPIAHIH